MTGRLVGGATYALASVGGLAAFLYPLWRPAVAASTAGAHAADAPIVLTLLVAACFVALVFEAGTGGLGPRAVAVLGMLVALNSVLRFVELALPGPAGFSPVFALVVLAGYAFGARFGFLMGALTMIVSAVVTGGVGPWLPYQMLAAGWVGLTAGWLPRRGGSEPVRRAEVAGLAAFGAVWGMLYGVIMTLWFWPFVDAPVAAATAGPASAALAAAARFAAFYAGTGLWWDLFRAAGNAVLILAAGRAVLTALLRFRARTGFRVAA